MSGPIQLITTSDGSHSLLNTELNETYHSTHGALQESIHVFIKMGFDFALKKNNLKEIAVLEIGFGTGLNALLTLQATQANRIVTRYTTLEAFPLDENIWSTLNYAAALQMEDDFKRLHRVAWEVESELVRDFHIQKHKTTLQEMQFGSSTYDVIYYDAFAPNKQPEMWELAILDKVVRCLKSGGVFVTYCAKGQLKRDLKSLGLQVETLEGPPGKKEMVRGVK